jgi:hypothetical protein
VGRSLKQEKSIVASVGGITKKKDEHEKDKARESLERGMMVKEKQVQGFNQRKHRAIPTFGIPNPAGAAQIYADERHVDTKNIMMLAPRRARKRKQCQNARDDPLKCRKDVP